MYEELEMIKKLIQKADVCIDCFYRQNYHQGGRYLQQFLADFMNGYDELIKISEKLQISEQAIQQTCEQFMQTQKQKDYIFMADLLEMQWIPWLYQLQEKVLKEQMQEEAAGISKQKEIYEKNIKALEKKNPVLLQKIKSENTGEETSQGSTLKLRYEVEATAIGSPTVIVTQKEERFYLHSTKNPYKEAALWAQEYYDEKSASYIIFGFALGYHVEALLEQSKKIHIKVLEWDSHMLNLAMHYRDLTDIWKEERVEILLEADIERLMRQIHFGTEHLLIHAPSLRKLHKCSYKELLEEYFMNMSTMKNQNILLDANFYANTSDLERIKNVDSLKEKFKNHAVILVAGGPSLDGMTEWLKDNQENYQILAVGTVVKKLLKAGIAPDYVIITDPQERTYEQIAQVDLKSIPLLYISTVYSGIPQNYAGDKYMILQEGYEPAEKLAKELGYQLYETGGSVATTALDVCIRLGSSKIICLGLDLAYTNHRTHASNTMDVMHVEQEKLKKVKAVSGEWVETAKNLDIYRHWIERRIRSVEDVAFINISEGAFIEGMENISLQEWKVFDAK